MPKIVTTQCHLFNVTFSKLQRATSLLPLAPTPKRYLMKKINIMSVAIFVFSIFTLSTSHATIDNKCLNEYWNSNVIEGTDFGCYTADNESSKVELLNNFVIQATGSCQGKVNFDAYTQFVSYSTQNLFCE